MERAGWILPPRQGFCSTHLPCRLQQDILGTFQSSLNMEHHINFLISTLFCVALLSASPLILRSREVHRLTPGISAEGPSRVVAVTARGSGRRRTSLQHHRWEMRFLQDATRLHFARKGLRTKEAVHRQWCDPFPMHLPEFRITSRRPEQTKSRTLDNCSRAGCLFWPRHPLPHNRDGKVGHVRRDLGNC